MAKIRVGIVFGGRSGEHEVSVRSAESIRANLNKSSYQIVDIFVDKNGNFDLELLKTVDVVFPIIHGSFGEDGSFQGVFEVLGLAYVGSGVLGSAIGMDKDIMKRLLAQSGLNVPKWITLRPNYSKDELGLAVKTLLLPIFVKPANLGSSVGVSKCDSLIELSLAIKKALQYDTKVLLEQAIVGREIECSVLGNRDLTVSLPGEVKITTGFYDYKSKYSANSTVDLIVPAQLTKRQITLLQQTALAVYKCLECRGLGRVDMFLTPDNQVVVNEINTLPGFTSISMYPKLWEVSGLGYSRLLDKLIMLALEEKKQKDDLKRRYDND